MNDIIVVATVRWDTKQGRQAGEQAGRQAGLSLALQTQVGQCQPFGAGLLGTPSRSAAVYIQLE